MYDSGLLTDIIAYELGGRGRMSDHKINHNQKEERMNKKIILSAFAVALVTTSVKAVDVVANASAVIQQAITAEEDVPMFFGNIIPDKTSTGTAIISPAGAVSNGEGAAMTFSGSPAAGLFAITAAPSTAMNITFGNGTLTSDVNSMTLDTFTMDSTPASNTTDASGNLALRVGASLHVGANQAPGTYNGTYTVMVNY